MSSERPRKNHWIIIKQKLTKLMKNGSWKKIQRQFWFGGIKDLIQKHIHLWKNQLRVRTNYQLGLVLNRANRTLNGSTLNRPRPDLIWPVPLNRYHGYIDVGDGCWRSNVLVTSSDFGDKACLQYQDLGTNIKYQSLTSHSGLLWRSYENLMKVNYSLISTGIIRWKNLRPIRCILIQD